MKIIIRVLLISLLGIAVLGGVAYMFIQELSANDETRITEVAEVIEKQPVQTNIEKPSMQEVQVQIYLHQMTHQKIVADEKRGAIQMSPDNIRNMLTIVRDNAGLYEHAAFYENTLVAWEEGNFSNAVAVHNTIWAWHNGTVGKATGLMTPEQEAEYVKTHFE